MAKIDIAKLSLQERKDLMAQLRGQTSPVSDPEYRAKCREMKAKLEKLCAKENISLADVFTLPKEDKTYTDPETGATWENWQKGRKPAWVKSEAA
jgi:hypothetical protein